MRKALNTLLFAVTITYSNAQIPIERPCAIYEGYVTTPNLTHVPTANKKASLKTLFLLC